MENYVEKWKTFFVPCLPVWRAGVIVRAVFAGVLVFGHTTHHTQYNILYYTITLYTIYPSTYTLYPILYRPIISTVLYIIQ